MRIFHTLLRTLVALACMAPTCDTHDRPLAESRSGAWAPISSPSPTATTSPASPTSTGSATQHQDVVHAMESVSGAPASTAKPTKSKSSTVHNGGGGGGETSTPPPPPPDPEPALPASGRRVGQACVAHDQCASGYCEVDVCKKQSGALLNTGEKCERSSECTSNNCTSSWVCE